MEKTTPPSSAGPFSPTGSDSKVPTYVLTPSGALRVHDEDKKSVEDGGGGGSLEVEKEAVVITPEDSPAPARRGLRPVISALIRGREGKRDFK